MEGVTLHERFVFFSSTLVLALLFRKLFRVLRIRLTCGCIREIDDTQFDTEVEAGRIAKVMIFQTPIGDGRKMAFIRQDGRSGHTFFPPKALDFGKMLFQGVAICQSGSKLSYTQFYREWERGNVMQIILERPSAFQCAALPFLTVDSEQMQCVLLPIGALNFSHRIVLAKKVSIFQMYRSDH